MRILIADDHAVVRRGLKEILAEEFKNARFGEAESGAETIGQVRQGDWDVLILDISMPDRSGLEVLKDVKAIRPKLPVLVLSVHPEDEYAVRTLRAGAAGYLTKETAPDKLVEAVNKAVIGGQYISVSLGERLADDVRKGRDGLPHEALSDREYEVVCMIASGKLVSEIAEELSLSVKTVSTYRTRALEKMGIKSNAALMRYAIDHKLVD